MKALPYTVVLPNVYQSVRCECGAPARYRVPVLLISSTGHARYDRLDLCPACYALFVCVEGCPAIEDIAAEATASETDRQGKGGSRPKQEI